MASPIEMIKGNERQTVYDNAKADALKADGWQRVDELPVAQQRELRDRPPVPWKGYDDMTAQEVIARSSGLTPDRVQEVVVYESRTKGRVSIVNKLLGRPDVTIRVSGPVEDVKITDLDTGKEVSIEETPKGKGK